MSKSFSILALYMTVQEKEFKFNVGDTFVCIEDYYFSNPYHYKESLKGYKVQAADENFFSTSSRISMANADSGTTFHQNTGRARDWYVGKEHCWFEECLHIEKDRDKINERLKDILAKYDAFVTEESNQIIENLMLQQKQIKEQIKTIKSGKRHFHIGFSDYDEMEFKKKLTDHFESILINKALFVSARKYEK